MGKTADKLVQELETLLEHASDRLTKEEVKIAKQFTLSAKQIKRMRVFPMHTIKIEQCPRCGLNHGDMYFVPLITNNKDFSHWTMCPENLEPILLLTTSSQFLS